MDRQEAVQKLARAGRFSIAHAEDLYDSFFEKPVVPQYVADWYEGNKQNLDLNLSGLVFDLATNSTIYHQEELKFKGIDDNYKFLNYGTSFKDWTFDDSKGAKGVRVAHTRKELETNGFGWVFDCEGVEVKEVTNE